MFCNILNLNQLGLNLSFNLISNGVYNWIGSMILSFEIIMDTIISYYPECSACHSIPVDRHTCHCHRNRANCTERHIQLGHTSPRTNRCHKHTAASRIDHEDSRHRKLLQRSFVELFSFLLIELARIPFKFDTLIEVVFNIPLMNYLIIF